MLSFLEAHDLVCSGCSAFLACLVSLSAEESADSRAPYDVSVISEFVDVFPEELPSLPPHREVNFAIDLIPNDTPISKVPYHLSPAELRELKKQLQELTDSGFIQLSTSP